jgi:hypothetical protein
MTPNRDVNSKLVDPVHSTEMAPGIALAVAEKLGGMRIFQCVIQGLLNKMFGDEWNTQ